MGDGELMEIIGSFAQYLSFWSANEAWRMRRSWRIKSAGLRMVRWEGDLIEVMV